MVLSSRGDCIAIGLAFPIVSAALVGLRFFMRKQRGLLFQLDDWLNLPAWLFVTGSCICLMHGTVSDYFREEELHTPGDVTPSERKFAQITAALFITWLAGNACIKLSILFFYRRIFVGQTFNRVSWSLIALTGMWTVYSFLSWLFFCGTNFKANFEGGWEVCPVWGSRLQLAVYLWDTLLDLGLLVLPIPLIWNLQVNLKRKLLLICAFLIGGLAFVASLNNTIAQYLYSVQFSYFQSGTTTIEGVSGQFLQGVDLVFFNWQTIEVGVGLIACNLSTLRPFWGSALPTGFMLRWHDSLESSRLFAKRMFSRPSRSGSSRGFRSRSIQAPGSPEPLENQWYGLPSLQSSSNPAASQGVVESQRGAKTRPLPDSLHWHTSQRHLTPTVTWSERSPVSSSPLSETTSGSKRLGILVRAESDSVRPPLAHIAMQSPDWDRSARTFYESNKSSVEDVSEGRSS